ncbi:hypothetical protein BJ165DRAFT_1535547 [Panaeolus papilionaceus]|nr:hypothetical protein BJ165DRAFT_1535547 [Panaeolus papilionaceus]
MITTSEIETYIPPLLRLPRRGSNFRKMMEPLGLADNLNKCQKIHKQTDSINAIESALKTAFPQYFIQHVNAQEALSFVEPMAKGIYCNYLRCVALKQIKNKKQKMEKEKENRVFIKRTGPRAVDVANTTQTALPASTTRVPTPADVTTSSAASSITPRLPTLAPPSQAGGSSSAPSSSSNHSHGINAVNAPPPNPGMTIEAYVVANHPTLLPTLQAVLNEGYDCVEKIDELFAMSADLQRMGFERLLIASQKVGGGKSFDILRVFTYIRRFAPT